MLYILFKISIFFASFRPSVHHSFWQFTRFDWTWLPSQPLRFAAEQRTSVQLELSLEHLDTITEQFLLLYLKFFDRNDARAASRTSSSSTIFHDREEPDSEEGSSGGQGRDRHLFASPGRWPGNNCRNPSVSGWPKVSSHYMDCAEWTGSS